MRLADICFSNCFTARYRHLLICVRVAPHSVASASGSRGIFTHSLLNRSSGQPSAVAISDKVAISAYQKAEKVIAALISKTQAECVT